MEWQQIVETFAAMSVEELREWVFSALPVLAVVLLLFALESRYFSGSSRLRSWARMRLVSLVMAPLTVAAVIVPARAVSGMEALAVFYGLLFTVAPVLWFGSHALVGKRLEPALTGPESAALAVSAALIFAIPVTAFFAAGFPLREAARGMTGKISRHSDPLPFTVKASQRYVMPGVGIVFAQSLLAQPGVALGAIDQRVNGPWYPTADTTHPSFCRDGNDLHLMWSAQEPAPELRLSWTDGGGRKGRSEFIATAGQQGNQPFVVNFGADGFEPAAPIPRARTYLELPWPDGTMYTEPLDQAAPNERDRECLTATRQRVRATGKGPVALVAIIFRPYGVPPLYARFVRPPPAPADPAGPQPARPTQP